MRHSLLLLAACALLVGCGVVRPIQIAAPCSPLSKQEAITALAGLVAAEGMTITIVNENVGILQASGPLRQTEEGKAEQNQWQFSVRGDTVYAYAKVVYTTNGLVTAEVSGTDEAGSSHRWYWNVRNGLQKMCGGSSLLFVPQ